MQNEFFTSVFFGVVATFEAVTLSRCSVRVKCLITLPETLLLRFCRTKLCKTEVPSAAPTQARNHQNKQLSLKIYKCSFHESKATVSLALFVLLLSSQIKTFSFPQV